MARRIISSKLQSYGFLGAMLGVAGFGPLGPVDASQVAPAPLVSFEESIRPILHQHCLPCHGGVKKQGGFALLAREQVLAAADSGLPLIVPKDPEGSLLWQRIRAQNPDDRMPPLGHAALSETQIEVIGAWIKQGATWPTHWSFVPPDKTAIGEQIGFQLDSLVASCLRQDAQVLAPKAGTPQLIRRLHLDLTGLLPEPDELDSMAKLIELGQIEVLIDRLLASPHFGERWARHWLDEARYADSLGYEKDSVKSDAWQFRDWVVDALNQDMPFDQFSRLQLAGDLIDPVSREGLLATKLHLQTQFNLEGGIDAEEDRVKRVIDRVNTVGSIWLGMTVACAQCHDHPYDAMTQREYYQLMAFFNNLDEDASFLMAVPPDAEQIMKEREVIQSELNALLARQLSDKSLNNQGVSQLVKLFNFDQQRGLTRHMRERVDEPRMTHVLIRGDFLRPDRDQEAVRPGFPRLGSPGLPNDQAPLDRQHLVDWLFSGRHPLTSRVMVNKVWARLMGRPLVETPQDFGARTPRPEHHVLLDGLASWWSSEGHWSLKRLIRLILLSQTYQQSSLPSQLMGQKVQDLASPLRQHRFRVEAEVLRDMSLQMAGLLVSQMGGPSVHPPVPKVVLQQSYSQYQRRSEGGDRYRRGLYTFFRRTAPDPNLRLFDCPDASASSALRPSSNNALQALALLNNEVFVEASHGVAARLVALGEGLSDQKRIERLFEMGLGRAASTQETQRMLGLLQFSRDHLSTLPEPKATFTAKGEWTEAQATAMAAWVPLARAMINLDAFLTRE